MSELISKEQAMAYPLSYEHYDKVHGSKKFISGIESYRDYIDGLPTVEERKHGHWVRQNGEVFCSVCWTTDEEVDRFLPRFDYCPYCGAIMDEVTE